MILKGQSRFVYIIWTVLGTATLVALFTGRYSVAFVSLATFLLTLLPIVFFNRFKIGFRI